MTTITVSSGTTIVSTRIPKTTGYLVEGSGTLNVVHGGTVSGLITISSGGAVAVAGGAVLDTIVFNSGTESILNGGRAVGTTLAGFNSYQYVDSGGTAVGTKVSSGGVESIQGGTASGTIVSTGGYEFVVGRARATTLAGGVQYVEFGGVASGTVVSRGAAYVDSGGVAVATTVRSGGVESIQVGGSDKGAKISGGEQDVYGTASGATVFTGSQVVESGGLAVGTMVSGGTLLVDSGGTASTTHVLARGTLDVLSGGTVNGIVVGSGGTAEIAGDAITGAVSIARGATLDVLSGSSTLLVASGKTIANSGVIKLENGATLILSGTVVNSGALFASGSDSLLKIEGVVSGGVAGVGNGVVEIAGSSRENVTFQSGGSGGLQLDGTGSAYTGKVTSFGQGGLNPNQFLDFASVTSTTGVGQFTYTPANASDTSGTLTVTDGTHSASVTLVGHYVQADFHAENIGGTLAITDPTLIYTGAVFLSGGTYSRDVIAQSSVTVAQNGGTVIIEGNMEALGPVSIIDGILEATSGGDINLENSVIDNGPDPSRLQAFGSGTITVQGPLLNGANGIIAAQFGAPTVNLESMVTNLGTIVTDTLATLTMEQGLVNSNTIAAFRTSLIAIGAGPTNPYVITNRGVISATDQSTITLTAGVTTSAATLGGIFNYGTIIANMDAGIVFGGGGVLTNAGTIGAEGTFNGVTINMAVTNLGTLVANETSTMLLNGSVSNPGVLMVTGNGAIAANTVTGGFAQLDGTGFGGESDSGFTTGSCDTIELGVSNTDVNFGTGDTGVLELSAENGTPNAYSGDVTGFTEGDGIELVGIAFVSGDQVVFTPGAADSSGGVLTVENSGHTVVYANINLAGEDPNGGVPNLYTNMDFAIAGDASHNNNIFISDPLVTMQKPGNAPAAVGDGAILEINTPDSSNVTFTGSAGKLVLDQPATFTGAVSGFGAQNGIDLSQIAFGANTTLGYSENNSGTGGTLTVSDGAQSAKIALLGNYMASSFAAAGDQHGGTLVTEASQSANQQPQLSHPHP